MDLLATFPMAISGLTFLILSKDENNKKYRVAGIMMLLASLISFLTYFVYK
ncbi:hypothetical protein GCM10025879_08070 [Leuconostoc litchii]|uniref:hypothetical protein n=1 Tax=Leuconostoc litchii TaxID=1981069 RepID=UPI00142F0F57|nr:hypothetical protein [Leuconostoc litchii]GMA69561.1 hypothetical protein GCM10025879_08070 [Leuconostoc litchii]